MKQPVFISVLAVFLWLNSLMAQQNQTVQIAEDFYKHLKGIGSFTDPKTKKKVDIDLIMNFRRKGDKISGSYHNYAENSYYTIKGEMKNNNSFIIYQYDNKFSLVGIFKGIFVDNKTVKGSWKSDDELREMTFQMVEEYSNSVRFDNYTDTSIYHIQDDPKLPYVVLNLDYLHPVEYKNKEVLPKAAQTLEKYFFGSYSLVGNPVENIEKKKNDFFSDYKQIVERTYMLAKQNKAINKEMMLMYIRSAKYSISVYYNEDNLLVISKDSLEEAGGESVTEGRSFTIIDMTNGNCIKVDDLFFYPKYKDMMADVFKKKIKEWLNIESDKDLIEQGFDKDQIKYNKNVFVDKFGLGFYFNPWELNERYVVVYFTWKEISKYLKDKSPISHLFPKDIVFETRTLTPDDLPKPKIVDPEEEKDDEDDGFQDGIIMPEDKNSDKTNNEEIVFPEDDETPSGDTPKKDTPENK
jgi:hypothetical protein